MTFDNTPARRPNRLAMMTWQDVAERIAAGADAILPVGAGGKQHGLHLPMATDQIQAEWLADRLAERGNALICPTLTYGAYPAFVEYAGSVSLSDATFENLAFEIVGCLLGFGVPRVIVLNTGISTIAPIDRALHRIAQPDRVRHLKVYSGPRFERVLAERCAPAHGRHADEIETSIMLAIAPHLVDMPRAQASPPGTDGSAPGPLRARDATSANYAPSGSFGDPTRATSDTGSALVSAILDDLTEALAGRS